MSPHEYYYGRFRAHFATFWRSLEYNGSCSRARAHQKQDFWGHRSYSMIKNALDAEGVYFSVGDLYFAPQHDLPDHLTDIPKGDQIDFLCALFYTVLIDQVMYTHCRADYASFQGLTQYPKMDRTVGWARTMIMANPYEVFNDEVLQPRRLSVKQVRKRLKHWVCFIVDDLQNFFRDQKVGSTTWEMVRDAMLSDKDCIWGSYGSMLHQSLLGESPQTP